MKFWKTAALATVIVAAAGLAAGPTPAIHGQTRAPRIVTPRAAEVFWSGGGSRLGVSITDVSADDSKTKGNAGVLIDDVDEDSPAAKAGLKKGTSSWSSTAIASAVSGSSRGLFRRPPPAARSPLW